MGFFNGETSYDRTVYHFGVVAEALNRTMPMFAEMLVKPDLGIERIKANVDVVDQEFMDKRQDDAYRQEIVSRVTGNRSHPYTGYFGGNRGSLESKGYPSLRDELVSLNKNRYSSDRMRLVVLGSGKGPFQPTPFSPH